MAKQNIKDPGAHHNSSGALIRRFLPYLAKHKAVLFLDLFCAALTTLCDIFLPKIMSTITNSAMGVGITLTTGIVLKLAGIYFVLRIIDGAAQYFMSGIGHIMGVHIETDMRRDAFDHLLLLDHTYYNNTFPNVTPAIQANLFFYLSQCSRGLFQELSPVLFHSLLPYKRVLVCFRLYLSAINILFLQTNHALFNQYGDDCIKIKVDAFNHMMGSKAVDCCER